MNFFSRSLLALLLAVGLCCATWADGWTSKGRTWVHSNGLSVTFPEGYLASVDKTGHLNATAKGGFISFVFSPLKGKEQMKEAMKGILQTMQQARVDLAKETSSCTQNGVDVAYQNGSRVNSHGIPFHVRLGIFNKKEAYLLMQMVVAQELMEKNSGPLDEILGSVK